MLKVLQTEQRRLHGRHGWLNAGLRVGLVNALVHAEGARGGAHGGESVDNGLQSGAARAYRLVAENGVQGHLQVGSARRVRHGAGVPERGRASKIYSAVGWGGGCAWACSVSSNLACRLVA